MIKTTIVGWSKSLKGASSMDVEGLSPDDFWEMEIRQRLAMDKRSWITARQHTVRHEESAEHAEAIYEIVPSDLTVQEIADDVVEGWPPVKAAELLAPKHATWLYDSLLSQINDDLSQLLFGSVTVEQFEVKKHVKDWMEPVHI